MCVYAHVTFFTFLIGNVNKLCNSYNSLPPTQCVQYIWFTICNTRAVSLLLKVQKNPKDKQCECIQFQTVKDMQNLHSTL